MRSRNIATCPTRSVAGRWTGLGLVAATLVTAGSAAAEMTVPNVVLPWYNGVISNVGTNLSCSIPPLVEIRVQGYVGWSLQPPSRTPAVGEIFYAHLVLGHPGNPCAGSAIGIELLLPPGVATAASASDPAFCFARTPPTPTRPFPLLINLANDAGYGCPQVFPQGLEGLRITPPQGGAGGGWGMAAGFFLELLVPLRATSVQPGTTSIRFRVNPDIGVVGYPSVPLLVNGDVLFRTSFEDNQLTLDICTVTPLASGC